MFWVEGASNLGGLNITNGVSIANRGIPASFFDKFLGLFLEGFIHEHVQVFDAISKLDVD